MSSKNLFEQEFKGLLRRILEHYRYRLEKWDDNLELKPLGSDWIKASVKELEFEQSTLMDNLEKAIEATNQIPADVPSFKILCETTSHDERDLKREWAPFKLIVHIAAQRYKADLKEISEELGLEKLENLKELYAKIDEFLISRLYHSELVGF
jgi:hypothetical protein